METTTHFAEMSDAAERGDLATVASLLNKGVSADDPSGGWGALRIAAYHGRTDVVRLLLERGEDPGDVLLTTANMGRTLAVQELLAAGANVSVADKDDGWTALHFAVRPDGPFNRGHFRVVRALLKAGANPDVRDKSGVAPLSLVMDGDRKTIAVLLKAGADINAQDKSGRTPLHWAVVRGEYNTANCLFEHGCDARLRDEAGKTAICYAAFSGQYSAYRLIELFLEHGLNPSPVDRAALIDSLDSFRSQLELQLDREARNGSAG
jgi:cytohesin